MKIKSTDKIDIGKNIKTIVESKNIKKSDIIREMQLSGISINKQRFYKLEHNISNITADEIYMLAKILGCDIADFFKPNNNSEE